MKKLSLMVILSLLSMIATAQESPLKKIERKVGSLGTFKASVVFSTQGERGGKTDYKGEMLVKGKAYAIKFGQMEIYGDGKSIWTYTPARSEVIIEKAPATGGLMSSPTNFMAVSEIDFTSVASGTKVIGGASYNALSLKPKGDMEKNVKSVFVTYDGAYMPKEVIATTAEGLKVSILINKITAMPFIADADLTFDVKRAKEVIDFR